MKKIVVTFFALLLVTCLAGYAQATYWLPTESGEVDVNYLTYTGSGSYAIFDDSSSLGTGDDHLVLGSFADTIYFVQNGSDWDLYSGSVGGSPDLTLSGSARFQLAWMPSGESTWYGDTGYTNLSPGVYEVEWTNVGSPPSHIVQIDAVPSIPLPPSDAILFSGLLGIFGVRRFRRNG